MVAPSGAGMPSTTRRSGSPAACASIVRIVWTIAAHYRALEPRAWSLIGCPPVRAFYSDHFVLPLPEGHRFPMAKYARLRERIVAERIIAPADLHEAPAASWQDIRLVHDASYADD